MSSIEEKIRNKQDQNRHEEILNVLRKLASDLKKEPFVDPNISKLILDNNANINRFIEKLNDISKPIIPQPKVDVNVDNNNIAEAIEKFNELARDILKGQDQILEALLVRPVKLEAKRYSDYGNAQIKEVKIVYDKIY